MDIEAIVEKYERLIPAGAYTLGECIRAALTELSEAHAIEMRAYEATVENLEERILELEAERVPKRFLSDVITAAGLLEHGRRDMGLSERLAVDAFALLTSAPAPVVTEATGKPGLQVDVERVPVEIRQFRHPQWADRSRWCDIENPSDEQSLAEAGMVFRTIYAAPRRCHLCDYQHGHKIGCVNNPVDIALRAAAPQQKKEGE